MGAKETPGPSGEDTDRIVDNAWDLLRRTKPSLYSLLVRWFSEFVKPLPTDSGKANGWDAWVRETAVQLQLTPSELQDQLGITEESLREALEASRASVEKDGVDQHQEDRPVDQLAHLLSESIKKTAAGKPISEDLRTALLRVCAPSDQHRVTRLIHEARLGDSSAVDELEPLIRHELHRRAEAFMRKERPGHTLQATVLVNEALLTLTSAESLQFKDRNHFFAIASIVMRRLLREYAQQREAEKRGGGKHQRVPLDTTKLPITDDKTIDFLELDEALSRLEAVDSEMARVVELRFFAGLNTTEVADVLGVGERTVKRKWAAAKLLLYDYLTPGE